MYKADSEVTLCRGQLITYDLPRVTINSSRLDPIQQEQPHRLSIDDSGALSRGLVKSMPQGTYVYYAFMSTSQRGYIPRSMNPQAVDVPSQVDSY